MYDKGGAGSRITRSCYTKNMSILSVSTAIVAELCACLTLLPGWSTRERLVAFTASAVVLICTLVGASRVIAW